MSILKIGYCGAYCKTCRAAAACRGCKTGYDNRQRIRKAKCAMKICCIQKNHQTCADCDAYDSCSAHNAFYQKSGYKYAKYRQATAYI